MTGAAELTATYQEYLDGSERLKETEKQNRTGNNKGQPNFVCRICGSKEFKEVHKSNGIIGPRGRSQRVYCVCGGCSVMFIDPDKFSANRK